MNTELGKRIRALRESCKLTQEEVARVIGISRQKLARLESGQSDITFSFLEQFSKIVGKTVPEITAGLASASSATAYRTDGIVAGSLDLVTDMLDLFYANKHVYDKVRG